MNTRAKWVEGVTDLSGRLGDAAAYLEVPAVAERTGLSPSTITDLLSRKEITSTTNVLAPISRPAARISNVPLYSEEQVAEVVDRQRRTGHRHLGGGDKPLPSLSAAKCQQRKLVSVREIAELANAKDADGVHEQTVRRWARDAEDFPAAVALRSRQGGHPGVPEVMRPRRKAITWLVQHGYRRADGQTDPAEIPEPRAESSSEAPVSA
jgi:hypothetical protein